MNRSEAKSKGDRFYNNSNDCVNGHKSPYRYTSNGECVNCSKENQDKEKKKSYDKKRNIEKHEEIREKRKEYYDKNRDKIKERNLAWADRNKDAVSIIKKNYKHRRRLIEKDGMSTSDLRLFIKSSDKICFYCDSLCEDLFHIDHIIPICKGGDHQPYNLCISCKTCNIRKNSTDPEIFIDRILDGFYEDNE